MPVACADQKEAPFWGAVQNHLIRSGSGFCPRIITRAKGCQLWVSDHHLQ